MRKSDVLIFGTSMEYLNLLGNELDRKMVPHIWHLIVPRKGVVPPQEGYFQDGLERHHPKLLITSWSCIGPAVRMAEKIMERPRPIQKWVVSSYPARVLEEHLATTWADEIYGGSTDPSYLAEEVGRFLSTLCPAVPA